MVYDTVSKRPNCPALGFVGERPYSYADMLNKITSLSALLESRGICKGDRVAILSTNQPNWGISYFAITTMGAIAVPILPDFSEKEIENVLNHSESKILFFSDNLYHKVKNLDTPALEISILIDNFGIIEKGSPNVDLQSIQGSLVEDSKPKRTNNIATDDIASIIYTSGTTGKSKGVMLSHKNLLTGAEQSGRIHTIDPTDRLLSILPLSHTYENTLGLILPISMGAAIYYLHKSPVPSVLMPAIKQVKPTIILSVPLIIEKVYKGKILPQIQENAATRIMYKVPPLRKLINRIVGKKLYETFGGCLKFFGIGGAKLNAEVEKFLFEANFPYAIGYGLTETSPLLAGFDSYKGRCGSTGFPVDNIELIINEPDSITGQGEIWAKGDNVMRGYYKEEELTRNVLSPDGWFKTGDIGCFDKQGYLHIKGRLKNMIIMSGGENIYPEDIEDIINKFKYVVESVVVQKKGKLVAMVHFNVDELEKRYNDFKEKANIAIDEKIEELRIELLEYVNARVNKFSRVQMVIAYPEPFKKTATKKIKRFLYS